MSEENTMTDFAIREGEQSIPENEIENENSTDSSSEKNETDNKPADEGDKENTHSEKKPFHEDPAVQSYIERQVNNWVSAIEESHKKNLDDAIAKVREEFGEARKDNKSQIEKPYWFGGDDKQWQDYLAFEYDRLAKAEERAIARITQLIS